ncbi:MAG: cupredoxin domain-containing protein [Myxococcota bacterium]|nr:cupredoxin domain-containing protein [Myxococcota bacterium]MDW8363721.1 cupredoxin domain-containing protein [Myxococcales bacterium]
MPHHLPEVASTFAPAIDGHIALIYVVCGVWLAAAEIALFWALFRYRRGASPRAAWMPADGARQAAWVLVPAAAVLGFDLFIEWDSARVWAHVKERTPRGNVEVRMTARQFGFDFHYPGPDGRLGTTDDVASRELRVPAGRIVRLEMESADVVHAFYVPELRLKQDIVPGRRIAAWFEPTRPGRYTIACAELCGVAHSLMQAPLLVEPVEAWRRWATQTGAIR